MERIISQKPTRVLDYPQKIRNLYDGGKGETLESQAHSMGDSPQRTINSHSLECTGHCMWLPIYKVITISLFWLYGYN